MNRLLQTIIARSELSRIGLFKFFFSMVFLLVLVTYDSYDPSPFNLLIPPDGVKNILGIPGALLAGFLIETFGLMACAIPIITLFSGRQKESFNIVLLIPEILEIFALTTLVGLLFLANDVDMIRICGSWGAVSSALLSEFPGKEISAAILILYQLLYFRENRIDLSAFNLLGLLLLILKTISKRTAGLTKQTSSRMVKYGVFNWTSPLTTVAVKSYERISGKIKSRLVLIRSRIGEIDILGRLIEAIESIIYRKGRKDDSDAAEVIADNRSTRRHHQALAMAVLEYERTLYLSDRKLFSKCEEEI